jgi:hypothetical protein
MRAGEMMIIGFAFRIITINHHNHAKLPKSRGGMGR